MGGRYGGSDDGDGGDGGAAPPSGCVGGGVTNPYLGCEGLTNELMGGRYGDSGAVVVVGGVGVPPPREKGCLRCPHCPTSKTFKLRHSLGQHMARVHPRACCAPVDVLRDLVGPSDEEDDGGGPGAAPQRPLRPVPLRRGVGPCTREEFLRSLHLPAHWGYQAMAAKIRLGGDTLGTSCPSVPVVGPA